LLTGVAVEKLHFLQNSNNLGDRKCLGKLRKSFVGHPDTILFLRISRERVFQHPQAISPTNYHVKARQRRSTSGMAMAGHLSSSHRIGNFHDSRNLDPQIKMLEAGGVAKAAQTPK
jgi:hypothetical protein